MILGRPIRRLLGAGWGALSKLKSEQQFIAVFVVICSALYHDISVTNIVSNQVINCVIAFNFNKGFIYPPNVQPFI